MCNLRSFLIWGIIGSTSNQKVFLAYFPPCFVIILGAYLFGSTKIKGAGSSFFFQILFILMKAPTASLLLLFYTSDTNKCIAVSTYEHLYVNLYEYEINQCSILYLVELIKCQLFRIRTPHTRTCTHKSRKVEILMQGLPKGGGFCFQLFG